MSKASRTATKPGQARKHGGGGGRGDLQPQSSTANGGSMDAEREIKRLAQRVVRSFYGSGVEAVFLDQLVRREPALKDELMSSRLGVNTKDLAKLAQPLLDAGLARSHIRNELREGAARVTPRVWYYFDLRQFVDVLKWRIHKIRDMFEAEHKDDTDARGYDCPRCKRSYKLLDVQHLFDPSTLSLICETCGTTLIENEGARKCEEAKHAVNRYNTQCDPIIVALRKTENMVVPTFDVEKWLKVNYPLDEKGLPVEASLASKDGSAKPSGAVQVELATAADVEARKRKEEEEEIAKRAANAQPVWFEKSTVEAGRQASPLVVEFKPDAIRLEDEEEDDDDDLFTAVSPAASTPATSLGHSGVFSSEDLTKPIGDRKRSRDAMEEDEMSDADSIGSQSKKFKLQPPSSPVIESTFDAEPVRREQQEEEDDDDDFEAVEADPLVSCAGELIRASVIASDLITYQSKMTPEEWSAYLTL